MAEPLEVVELRVESDGWAAGTTGTVVEVLDEGVIVEIADDDGRTLALLSLPEDTIKKIDIPEQRPLPV